MDNDKAYCMVSIGNVKVRKLNGVVCTITDVIHVPKLRRNQLFFGALSKLGVKVIIKGKKIKVIKHSLNLIKGVRARNLDPL